LDWTGEHNARRIGEKITRESGCCISIDPKAPLLREKANPGDDSG
jgi:hypothetical protein